MSDIVWPALPEWFWYPVVFVYGAIVGSFLNVVIYRLPLGKSLTNPPSTCPNCNYRLTFWDNIPLLSFLGLRARCRLCRQPISWRYFCVELFTACLWVALYHRLSDQSPVSWVGFVFVALFASVLVALVFIDLDHFIAPDELNLVGFLLGLGRDLACIGVVYLTAAFDFKAMTRPFLYFGWLPQSLVGAATYGGLLLLVSFIGFVYYARGETESLLQVARRFFTMEDAPEQGTVTVPGGEDAPEPEGDDPEEPPRLAFSPAFLCLIAALLLIPVAPLLAPLAFVVPLLLFSAIERAPRRFFHSNDLGLPASASAEVAAAAAEANEFAQETETGAAGAMGLGDVKLALAIGAVLGPALSLLSLFFATFIGAVTGVILTRIHNRSLRYGVPFVPFMAAGAIIVLLYGPAVIQWYTNKAFPAPPAAAPTVSDEHLKELRERAERRVGRGRP
jgi:leader peptidase (prepilin peptidase)/N-methyltransferase